MQQAKQAVDKASVPGKFQDEQEIWADFSCAFENSEQDTMLRTHGKLGGNGALKNLIRQAGVAAFIAGVLFNKSTK